jgi:hypothetical protein
MNTKKALQTIDYKVVLYLSTNMELSGKSAFGILSSHHMAGYNYKYKVSKLSGRQLKLILQQNGIYWWWF